MRTPGLRRPDRSAVIPLTLIGALLVGSLAQPVLGASPGSSATPTGAGAAWRDASLAPADRAASLLTQMTLEERIGQMTQIEEASLHPGDVTRLMLGSVLSGGGGAPAQNDAQGWYAFIAGLQDEALATRLGIPMLYGLDAVHGHNNVHGATIFPHNVGLGAADDADLAERIGRATAEEMTATGIRWDFGPVVAVPQDVRWGRTYEGFGQDPALVSRLSSAVIRGLQGDDLTAQDSVLATAKHYLGDGGTTFGTSTTGDYLLDQGVNEEDEATLRAIHLPPYEAAIDAGVRVVMASFSSTTAGKVHADHHLLTDVLKGELGFSGFIVSDWGAIDQVDPDYDTAVAKAISAGIDMAMVPYDGDRFQEAVRTDLANGSIARSRIDDAVRRILTVKFEMGLFEHPLPPPGNEAVVGSDAHRALAREAVAKSMVLLQTTPGVLPIGPDDTVLLSGPGADDIGLQSGGWTMTWQGSPGDITPGTTIAQALQHRLGDRLLATGGAAMRDGVYADVGIVVLAEQPYAEGVGDTAQMAIQSIGFPEAMREHVDRLLVIVLSGRPVILDDILPTADAVIAGWLPGTEGTGVADVLTGDAPFTGTTPYAWPRTPADAPRTGKAACDGALFPVGYGLDAAGTLLGPAACR